MTCSYSLRSLSSLSTQLDLLKPIIHVLLYQDEEPHLISFPSLGSGYSSTSLRGDVSSMELVRIFESIRIQISCSQVVLDVVGRDKAVMYRNKFEKILQALNNGWSKKHTKNIQIIRPNRQQARLWKQSKY
jgi:hypothetical protein